jgi:hypothetical protein
MVRLLFSRIPAVVRVPRREPSHRPSAANDIHAKDDDLSRVVYAEAGQHSWSASASWLSPSGNHTRYR